jgi:hypothetical protein
MSNRELEMLADRDQNPLTRQLASEILLLRKSIAKAKQYLEQSEQPFYEGLKTLNALRIS